MPAFGDELGTDDGGGSATPQLHEFKKITLLVLRSGHEEKLIEDHQCVFLVLLHELLIASLNPCGFELIEQFRKTYILIDLVYTLD